MKGKLSLTPPATSNADKLKAFIEEPEKKIQGSEPEDQSAVVEEPAMEAKKTPSKKAKKESYPWEAPGVVPEIIKTIVLRLSLPDKLKIEHIVDNSLDYKSIHGFCLQAVLTQIDKESKKMGF